MKNFFKPQVSDKRAQNPADAKERSEQALKAFKERKNEKEGEDYYATVIKKREKEKRRALYRNTFCVLMVIGIVITIWFPEILFQKQDGFVTHEYDNGNKYVGDFKDGKPHGLGTFTDSRGMVYVGQWREGVMHGEGTMTIPRISIYAGEWRDGKKHGQGTTTFLFELVKGKTFVGEYKHDEQWQGMKYSKDGTLVAKVTKGIEQAVGSDTIGNTVTTPSSNGTSGYVGGLKGGKPLNGKSAFTDADGAKYVGEVKNGKMHGQGTWTHPDGDKYVGEWKEDMKHGQGTMTWSNGRIYIGEWKNGREHGQGTKTSSFGWKYVGEWMNGSAHGQGILTRKNGVKYVGEWKNRKEWEGTYYDKDGNVIATFSEGVKKSVQ